MTSNLEIANILTLKKLHHLKLSFLCSMFENLYIASSLHNLYLFL